MLISETNILKTYQLEEREAAVLRMPINGDGGFQKFMRHVQHQLKPDNTISLTKTTIGKIDKMVRHGEGCGGFQGRLADIFARSLNVTMDRKGPLL